MMINYCNQKFKTRSLFKKYVHIFTLLFLLGNHLNSLGKEIAPGLKYMNFKLKKPAESIHILIADPQKISFKIGVANNKCSSSQKTSELAKKSTIFAAINGGLFDFGCKTKTQDNLIKLLDLVGLATYNAFPIGTLCKNKKYYSLSNVYGGAIGWNNADSAPTFGTIKTTPHLYINNVACPVQEFNKPHSTGPTIFTSNFDTQTSLHDEPMDEILIENEKVTKIYRAVPGNTPIPEDGYIYSIPSRDQVFSAQIQENDTAYLVITNNTKSPSISEKWDVMDNIIAGTPLLIQMDEIPEDVKHFQSQFYSERQPRTAVGILKNGQWVFVVVDGRQKHSQGLSLLELALFMKRLGCTDALNLDGGGSSTFVVNHQLCNSPSGRHHTVVRQERPISNAILLCPKE